MGGRTALGAYFITLHCFMAAITPKGEQQLRAFERL